jgi:hypothetical protein
MGAAAERSSAKVTVGRVFIADGPLPNVVAEPQPRGSVSFRASQFSELRPSVPSLAEERTRFAGLVLGVMTLAQFK